MVDFGALFIASRGQPVEYGGQMICMGDTIILAPDARVRVVRESSKAGWRQGIHLSVDGRFNVGGQTFQKAIVLWADTAPDSDIIGVSSKDGICRVKNVWDTGDGTMHSWHNGGAMIVEQTDLGRRYRCNDGHPNDDFDDIVFRLEPVHGDAAEHGGADGGVGSAARGRQ